MGEVINPYGTPQFNSSVLNPIPPISTLKETDLLTTKGIEGVNAFVTAKNSRYPIFDSDDDILYIKRTDANNNPTVRMFAFSEISMEDYIKIKAKNSPYATKDDLNELKEGLKNVEQLIRKFQSAGGKSDANPTTRNNASGRNGNS